MFSSISIVNIDNSDLGKVDVYDALYPRFEEKVILNNDTKKRMMLIDKFKDNFNIEKINHIFTAFLDSYLKTSINNYINFKFTEDDYKAIYYVYDGLTFRSTIWKKVVHKPNGKYKRIIEIKLSNDAFVYKQLNHFDFPLKEIRHERNKWIVLNEEQNDTFSSILAFIGKCIDDGILIEPLDYAVYYNDTYDRLDFEFDFSDQLGECEFSINYEPGYPEHGKRGKPYSRIRNTKTIEGTSEDINKKFYG